MKIDQLVDRGLARKELVKRYKHDIVYKDGRGVWTKPYPKDVESAKRLLANNGHVVLNDLPIEEAVDKYLEWLTTSTPLK